MDSGRISAEKRKDAKSNVSPELPHMAVVEFATQAPNKIRMFDTRVIYDENALFKS